MFSFVSAWLLLFSIMPASSIHVVIRAVANSLLFCTVFNCMTIPQFIIHSAVHEHFACFLAFMNVLIYVFCCSYVGYIPISGTACS